MSRTIKNISFIVPVYNEEELLTDNLKILETGLIKFLGKENFEIIVINNASTDKTPHILKKVQNQKIKSYSIQEKGIGIAFKFAIKKAKYKYLVFSAIDLPFGFSDLKNAYKIWSKYDLIFGSKAHPKSKVNTSFKRKLYSRIYRGLLKLLFNIKVKDSQGTIFLKKGKIKPILKYCTANDAFFTTQLAIYANEANLSIFEVPVIMTKQYGRTSKYNLLTDGRNMFFSLIREYIHLSSPHTKAAGGTGK